ncbi:MAG: phage tail protein [Eubacterium sp.]|nr:phage tail protein [Eubacterium sp.]
MNNYGITSENLLRVFPEILAKDENMLALASSISDELALRPDEIASLMLYSRIDELSEKLLDILAYDFKVDWWDYNYSLEEKRKTLKDSWNVHRTLGTKGAVEKAISAIYPDTKVEEWFTYGGDPYHFKLLLDATYEGVNPTKHKRVLDRVEYYKNLRSHLDNIEYVAFPAGYCRNYKAAAVAGMGMAFTVEVAMYGLG